jgi:hypothetical protein
MKGEIYQGWLCLEINRQSAVLLPLSARQWVEIDIHKSGHF